MVTPIPIAIINMILEYNETQEFASLQPMVKYYKPTDRLNANFWFNFLHHSQPSRGIEAFLIHPQVILSIKSIAENKKYLSFVTEYGDNRFLFSDDNDRVWNIHQTVQLTCDCEIVTYELLVKLCKKHRLFLIFTEKSKASSPLTFQKLRKMLDFAAVQ